jgi:ABC-type sulfate transport system substrate-binding protein
LPGNYHDWIAIAPAGSPFTSHVAFVFTFGQTIGTATFTAPAAGSYVARAFANDDEILLAESAPFTVNAGATISTDQSSYNNGSTITVSYAGLPGNLHDWIAIAPAGSPFTSHVAFVFTNGMTSGTAMFSAPAAGSYVARAFANDDEILLAESAPFTVNAGPMGPTISTDQSSYNNGSTITVSYAGLPGNYHDWIAIAPAGSPFTSHVAFVFTFGQTSGTATFSAPAAGSYVARAFANDDEILLAESAPFTVNAGATISTDQSSYNSGSTITVSYAGLPGNYHDWIAIAPAGSPFTSHVAFVFTFGQTSGTATFSAPAAGSYVARAFANDDEILLAESAPFTVNAAPPAATISTDQSSYSSGSTITVSYAGLPGNYHDWIAIAPAGSPFTSHVAFVFTFGQTSGTATFSAPANGLYVARAFANDDEILLAESAVFTVCSDRRGAALLRRQAERCRGESTQLLHRQRVRGDHLRSRHPRGHLSGAAHGRGRQPRSHPPGARSRERLGHRPVHARRAGRKRL